MSLKYIKINLEDIVEQYGEDRAKAILADFSCELNKDVDDFLKIKAIERISLVQRTIGCQFIFLECEDKEKLKEFYTQNDYVEFGKCKLDGDETNLDGSICCSGYVIR